MRIRTLLLAAVSCLALAGGARAQDAPDKEAVAAAVAALDEASKANDETMIVEAIEASQGVVDPAVIGRIARGLTSRSQAVALASMRALGHMDHPAALKALHDLYLKDRQLSKHEERFATLLKEIGRHGDPSSVKILASHPFKNLTVASGTARIMGLGNIRDASAIEELMKAAEKAGGQTRGGVASSWSGQFKQQFRTALAVLTGQDLGYVYDAWRDWYRKNRKTFKVPAERPQIAKELSDYWEAYWGVPYYEGKDAPAPPAPLGTPYGRVANPTKAQVDETVANLKAAFKTKDDDARIHAIQEAAAVVDRKVVHAIAQALAIRNDPVRLAAIDALGWMDHPDALKQLHRLYRREKDLNKDEEVFAALLKAIGRHGDKSSIAVLASDPFKRLTLASGQARILGLGNIRDKESVETLIKGMRLVGGRTRGSRSAGQPRLIEEFRTSLAVLTGVDVGASAQEWEKWWRENKKTFKMSKRRPAIPDQLKARWEDYWGEPYREGLEK